MENMFIQVDKVCEILGVSRYKAYQLMRQRNAELENVLQSMERCFVSISWRDSMERMGVTAAYRYKRLGVDAGGLLP